MPGPDPRYSTAAGGVGIFDPDKGKLSPIFKSEFPGVPSSVASLGDSIGKIGIDFPSPWLTKVLEDQIFGARNLFLLTAVQAEWEFRA